MSDVVILKNLIITVGNEYNGGLIHTSLIGNSDQPRHLIDGLLTYSSESVLFIYLMLIDRPTSAANGLFNIDSLQMISQTCVHALP